MIIADIYCYLILIWLRVILLIPEQFIKYMIFDTVRCSESSQWVSQVSAVFCGQTDGFLLTPVLSSVHHVVFIFFPLHSCCCCWYRARLLLDRTEEWSINKQAVVFSLYWPGYRCRSIKMWKFPSKLSYSHISCCKETNLCLWHVCMCI